MLVMDAEKLMQKSEKVVEGGKPKPHPHASIHLEKYRLTKTTPLLSNPYQLVENNDAVWDDGVAPEVALDFDCQHVSSSEGILSWLGGLSLFVGLYQFVKITDPQSKNPAVNRIMNVVVDAPRTGPPVIEE